MSAKKPELNKRIKTIRLDLNLTQQEFSDLLEVGQSTIAAIESGTNQPSNHLLTILAERFTINENWLKYGKGPVYKNAVEILTAAVQKIEKPAQAEQAFLQVINNHYQDLTKAENDFYYLVNKLLLAYENGNRDLKGYLLIQLKKTFADELNLKQEI
ncbi:helix-turn-helix domain-containing protein [Halanaerobium salsuginis]|uniref:Helix-turn-helix domain-containing protein n=1 Tax=Halanaerobium salsuginis TaxID=29563 RepID=A0A1I4IP53_9FIRM|nr:helix-turn-helix transcriptional regulator [Halanaerobium salsuginis]SFL56074.1 Helix-turn-helix domain-containing protein [Halanaerobium salsuginis]